MLARAFVRWMSEHRPEIGLEVVAFRGGELLDDFVRLAPTRVLLDPSEPWDHDAPDPRRQAVATQRASGGAAPAGTLLVSVAAGQVLPYLPPSDAPVVAWVVEQGHDLHWLDGPLGLGDRVTSWFAGSEGTRAELSQRLPSGTSVVVVPEFVEHAVAADDRTAANCRAALGAEAGDLLVLGAGIATVRKAPDLFVEVAMHADAAGIRARFVWLGGERDPLFPRVRAQVDELGLENVRLMGSVADLSPWLTAADVFLHPARLDAFPLVCLHAATVGTPVVGFRGAGGLEEMFGDAFVGADFPDVGEMASIIGGFVDGAARRRVGRSQADAVVGRFSSDAAAPVLWNALQATTVGAGR